MLPSFFLSVFGHFTGLKCLDGELCCCYVFRRRNGERRSTPREVHDSAQLPPVLPDPPLKWSVVCGQHYTPLLGMLQNRKAAPVFGARHVRTHHCLVCSKAAPVWCKACHNAPLLGVLQNPKASPVRCKACQNKPLVGVLQNCSVQSMSRHTIALCAPKPQSSLCSVLGTSEHIIAGCAPKPQSSPCLVQSMLGHTIT